MTIPASFLSLVAEAARLPPALRRLLVRRSLAAASAEERAALRVQLDSVDWLALDALPPDQWPAAISPALRPGLRDLAHLTHDILQQEILP